MLGFGASNHKVLQLFQLQLTITAYPVCGRLCQGRFSMMKIKLHIATDILILLHAMFVSTSNMTDCDGADGAASMIDYADS